jgi:hypothetical protein
MSGNSAQAGADGCSADGGGTSTMTLARPSPRSGRKGGATPIVSNGPTYERLGQRPLSDPDNGQRYKFLAHRQCRLKCELESAQAAIHEDPCRHTRAYAAFSIAK